MNEEIKALMQLLKPVQTGFSKHYDECTFKTKEGYNYTIMHFFETVIYGNKNTLTIYRTCPLNLSNNTVMKAQIIESAEDFRNLLLKNAELIHHVFNPTQLEILKSQVAFQK
jgi:hypothetical protein